MFRESSAKVPRKFRTGNGAERSARSENFPRVKHAINLFFAGNPRSAAERTLMGWKTRGRGRKTPLGALNAENPHAMRVEKLGAGAENAAWRATARSRLKNRTEMLRAARGSVGTLCPPVRAGRENLPRGVRRGVRAQFRAERVRVSPPRSGTGRAERGGGGAERPRRCSERSELGAQQRGGACGGEHRAQQRGGACGEHVGGRAPRAAAGRSLWGASTARSSGAEPVGGEHRAQQRGGACGEAAAGAPRFDWCAATARRVLIGAQPPRAAF
jgi:hypothetical protein